MESFKSFPPQSSFQPPLNQSPHVPPPQAPLQPTRQNHNKGFAPNFNQIQPNSSIHHTGFGSSSHHHRPSRTTQQQQQQQQQYPYPPPPPPPPPAPMPPSSINSQPPPPSMYYPSSHYSQFDDPHSLPPPPPPPPSVPPPPPPSSPPPNSSIPPPPPPLDPPSFPPPPPPSSSSAPPPNQAKESRFHDNRRSHNREGPRDANGSGWRESGHSKHGLPPKQKGSAVPMPSANAPRVPNAIARRVETEEERRLRKRREYEKQRQEDKQRQLLKESQNTVLHKTQIMSSGMKGHGSIVGSRVGEKKATPFLSGERIENRLKKPTTFLCKLKFRNELPDPTAQPKLLSLNTYKEQYTKYTITSLEKMHKPKLFVEPDIGVPLDLLDISVYNSTTTGPPHTAEDEKLLLDAEVANPIKQDGIKRKERPTDKGVSWLVKTQYISPLSTDAAKMSLTEKQAKELRETRGGRNLLENLNNRENQIQEIEASFEACKLRPVHATSDKLQPVEILPLLPDFDRYDDQFVLAAFDGDPTADSEIYSKLDRSVRDDHESHAIMKSFIGAGSEQAKPEKFLAYMVPSPDELWKDMYDEHEDILYTWVREYQWDVRGDDADDPTTYLVTFDDEEARYLPLPTKLILRKKRPKEGRSNDEVEQYPVPSRVTVRRRSTVAAVELKESGDYVSSNSKRGRSAIEDGLETPVPRHKVARVQDMDHFSGAEDDMSD